MLVEWLNWVRSMRVDQLLVVLGILMLIDTPRYALTAVGMMLWDIVKSGWSGCLPGPHSRSWDYCPRITVLIAGYNEADTIAETMASAWSCYPDMQLIVVDDGSDDGMAEAAEAFAEGKDDVLVIRRDRRGGKSSALNVGLHYATSDIVVSIDADSRLNTTSIYELIQPLRDESVAAVSATVLAWNPFASLCAMLQAYEYRQTIFISRMFRGRTGLLGIVSGAFGAFRARVLHEMGGWDVGPGEDADLILRMRKANHKIAVAPYATCLTNVPTSWTRLFRQRCRWDRTVITFECRKHADLGSLTSRNSRWSDFSLMAERWFFNVVCVYMFWLYGIWVVCAYPGGPLNLIMLLYACGLCVELLQMMVLLFYTDRLKHDLALASVLPLYPLYQVFLKTVDVIALTKEMLLRDSSDDNFVPAHVRKATWRW